MNDADQAAAFDKRAREAYAILKLALRDGWESQRQNAEAWGRRVAMLEAGDLSIATDKALAGERGGEAGGLTADRTDQHPASPGG